ncbi:MAG: transcriptional repressor NrdR [Clostridia bacterium]|nr:transcriptional repressor NrdR [Clostridia bacterium]
MKCPLCNHPDSRVLDSRPIDEGVSIKRRRECPSCGKRFTTYEVVDIVPIAVIKRDGRREFFDKHKLARGIRIACQKRAVDADAIALSIEQELMNEVRTEITSVEIGEMVLLRLKECDIVSYIRFASIYRDFQDIDSFTAELKALSKKPRKKPLQGGASEDNK